MRKSVFKKNLQGQGWLFPPRLDQNIAENAPVRLVNAIVEALYICVIERTSSYHPRMRLKTALVAHLDVCV
jgi:transposase